MARRLPLGPRLALSFAVPATLAVVGVGAAAYQGTRAALEEELGRRLCALARVAAATVPADLAQALAPGDEETRTAQNIRRRLEAVHVGGVSRAMLFGADRVVKLDSSGELPIGADAPRLQLDTVEIDRALAGEPTASVLFSGRDGRMYKSCYAAVPGEGRMVVAVDGAADLFSVLTRLAGLFGVLTLLALVMLSVVAIVVARTLTAPLSRLSDQVRSVGHGDFSQAITVEADDEVGDVARALEEMRQNLRSRDEERQMMLAGIAHEVRNPLGGMELYAGILSETVADLPPETAPHVREEIVNAVGRIRRELSHLSGVVNDFLAFARDTPPQRRDVPVDTLLESVASLCATEATGKNVALTVASVPPGCVLQADEGQLKSALLNLVQNAVQACPAGSAVELGATVQAGFVTLRVKDNGPGMSAEAQTKALTPFFTTKEKGTGLGLPLVAKTARSHGGRLEIQSRPGEGCTCSLVLPLLSRS